MLMVIGPTFPASGASADPRGYETVRVHADYPVFVAPGQAGAERLMVYLHGRCGNPLAGIKSFPNASSRHGTLVSITGDTPCRKRPQARQWSTNVEYLSARVDAAIAAVQKHYQGRRFDTSELTVIGYSEGAMRAEHLAKKFPERFTRVVLLGSPMRPSPENLYRARVVATVVGEREPQETMRDGTRDLCEAQLPVRLFTLPRAYHGDYGPEAENVMGEVLDYVFGAAP